MPSKDATRSFGRIGLLLFPILIFLLAADSTFACPGSTTRVVYRTTTLNSRSVPMRTTVITYGNPTSYSRCGDDMYRTQSVRYVAPRRMATRYVAVRSADSYYPTSSPRYIAVRNDDYDYAPRYVAVHRQPAYIETGNRYVVVSNNYVPRTRYVAVRSTDIDDDYYDYSPRYVAVRRSPVYDTGTRYVAVRNMDSDYDTGRRYVAIRNSDSCACAGELRSSLDEIETVSPRHVVVKSDYLAGTREVIVPNTSYDDTAYMSVPSENFNRTYVGYNNTAYVDENDENYIPASTSAVITRRVTYVPANNDNDFDDQANLDSDDAAYVADDDIGDACLSKVAVQAPMELNTRSVSYVPVNNVDDYASLRGGGTTYVVNRAAPTIEYVPIVDDEDDIADADTNYVMADNVGDSCSCPVAVRTVNEDVSLRTASSVPADDADDVDVDDVGNVPVKRVGYADTTDIAADEIPATVRDVNTEPAYVAEESTAPVAEVDTDANVALTSTERIGGDLGYRDGFAAGKDTALRLEEFQPGNSVDFQNGTAGYEDTYGDMDVYRNAYRSKYLQGYSDGFNSAIGAG
jgi:hypothetical protein